MCCSLLLLDVEVVNVVDFVGDFFFFFGAVDEDDEDEDDDVADDGLDFFFFFLLPSEEGFFAASVKIVCRININVGVCVRKRGEGCVSAYIMCSIVCL